MKTIESKFMRAAFACLFCASFAASCTTESSVEIEQEEKKTIVEDIVSTAHSERMYIQSNDEFKQALQDGVLDLSPNRPFMGVLLNMTLKGQPNFEVAYTRLDGTMSEFSPVRLDNAEEDHINVGIPFNEMASKIHLRFNGENDSVEFIRAQFIETNEPEAHIHFDHESEVDDNGDELQTELSDDVIRLEVSIGGRYIPDQETVGIGRSQRVPYQSAGTRCGGQLLSGTRTFGRYMVNNFAGIRSYQGYNCRKIRGSNKLSMHGTGRAVDLMVPRFNGKADNTVVDPAANWLIRNAQQIGIQYFIWDRTSWNASRSGDKHRNYTGVHPHDDHLHVELTKEAAKGNAPWFRNGGPNRPPSQVSGGGGGGGGGAVTCSSRTLGRQAAVGESVQMSYAACGESRCGWATCSAQGGWDCHGADKVNASKNNPHADCAGVNQPGTTPDPVQPDPVVPTGKSCFSNTLGRSVADGDCVQMNYNSCGGTGSCQYAACDDGGWTCQPVAQCKGKKIDHVDCRPKPAPPKKSCFSKTLGRSVIHGEAVQMPYKACGGFACGYATCEDGGWSCGSGGSTKKYPHSACGN